MFASEALHRVLYPEAIGYILYREAGSKRSRKATDRMIESGHRQEILKRGKPNPPWQGEPLLGSSYGEEEIEAAVQAIREAADVSKGFGFSAQPIVDFEKAFAKYIGTKHAVAINSAGPGLDMAMRYLNLQPEQGYMLCLCLSALLLAHPDQQDRNTFFDDPEIHG